MILCDDFLTFFKHSGNNLAFCLWGYYAEQIEKALEESDLSNTVWLLRFAKMSSFRGNILFLLYFTKL